ncbi:DDE endonuclease [Xanthomonas oryzae pv. oryzicola]|nr:DDE endonuclease [Xanthomonas oryzae pv. oryzicola]
MKKRDGRLVSRVALEEMRLMALQRMGEGESPAEVASSFGLHRGWAYKVLARAQAGGAGALMERKGSGRPRTLTPAQERQVFGWVNGKNPRQHGFAFGL